MATRPEYPFEPKSNRWLEPGQFWAIPMTDGRFGCGRVMAVPAWFSSRMGFVGGIADWIGERPPKAEDLVGRAVIEQGGAHVRTIVVTGGRVLGHRSLEADGLTPEAPDDPW